MGGWGETRGMGEEELTVISFYFVLSMSENVCNWTLMLVFWSIFMICMNLIVWQTLALYSDCWHFCQTFNLWSLEDMTDIDILHTLCDVFVCIFLGSVLTGIDVCVCLCVCVCVCVCVWVCVFCACIYRRLATHEQYSVRQQWFWWHRGQWGQRCTGDGFPQGGVHTTFLF